jgi:hypothetical protein
MVSSVHNVAEDNALIPSDDYPTMGAFHGGEGEAAEVRREEGLAFERIKRIEFRLLNANNMWMGNRDCITDGVTFFLKAEATDVPGQDDVLKALLIH